MHEAVSDVLIDRAREAQGINRMLLLSLVAHALMIAAIVTMPTGWLTATQEQERVVMSISLGGAPGPDAGGMTQLSGRSVQTVAPDMKPTVAAAPMAKTPEMVVPDAAAKPAPRTKPVEKPAEKSSTRQPTAGAQVKTGAARAETGAAPIPFGGLSTGGGGGDGVTLDVKNFCCPAYLQTMKQLIHANWNQNQGTAGTNTVKFTILRDGRLAQIELAKPSANPLLDHESRRAVHYTQKLPPLPAEFPNPTLTVHLVFVYKR